jgi:hypothetical protein
MQLGGKGRRQVVWSQTLASVQLRSNLSGNTQVTTAIPSVWSAQLGRREKRDGTSWLSSKPLPHLQKLEEAHVRVPDGSLTISWLHIHVKKALGQAEHAV